MSVQKTRLPELLKKHQADLIKDWVKEQTSVVSRQGVLKEGELREQAGQFLRLLEEAAQQGSGDLTGEHWNPIKEFLNSITSSRTTQGFSPSETAMFVLSIKRPLFARLRKEYDKDPQGLADETWLATELLDKLGLLITEAHQKTREDLIARQQQEMLELSTPVVKLWDGVLALPMIGTLDSQRTQVVMEALLQRIVETGSDVAIIDITGVPMVDTLVAQHLLKTVTAARLMGADCIISGIRPQIAQTIVHLGVNLGDIITKATMADAFAVALQRRGLTVGRSKAAVAKAQLSHQ
jgi:rsbT co-antagonist protein RsbR